MGAHGAVTRFFEMADIVADKGTELILCLPVVYPHQQAEQGLLEKGLVFPVTGEVVQDIRHHPGRLGGIQDASLQFLKQSLRLYLQLLEMGAVILPKAFRQIPQAGSQVFAGGELIRQERKAIGCGIFCILSRQNGIDRFQQFGGFRPKLRGFFHQRAEEIKQRAFKKGGGIFLAHHFVHNGIGADQQRLEKLLDFLCHRIVVDRKKADDLFQQCDVFQIIYRHIRILQKIHQRSRARVPLVDVMLGQQGAAVGFSGDVADFLQIKGDGGIGNIFILLDNILADYRRCHFQNVSHNSRFPSFCICQRIPLRISPSR